LHVPPPPLSDPESIKQQEEIARLADTLRQTRFADTQTSNDEDEFFPRRKTTTSPLVLRKVRSMNDENARWQETRASSIAKLHLPKRPAVDGGNKIRRNSHSLTRRHSLTSMSKTQAAAMIPPVYPVHNEESWFSRLKRSFSGRNKRKVSSRKLIPMPPPPKRPTSQRRRSEATTQPRFNPATNTYMRDTRSNSDHLRMITAELNMMRARKLLSPLKPRGFLPRRRDSFVRGDISKRSSHLRHQVLEQELVDDEDRVVADDESTCARDQ
jgi:hypothetical protein